MSLRLLVYGGRHYRDRAFLFAALDHLHRTRGIAEVIHGAAPGADNMADEWATARGVPCTPVIADWSTHHHSAGPIRNQQMADMKPDAAVQFEGGKGTADMRRRLDKAKVPVWEPQATLSHR